jgi:hypothetical protein
MEDLSRTFSLLCGYLQRHREKVLRESIIETLLPFILVPPIDEGNTDTGHARESLCAMRRKVQVTIETRQLLVVRKMNGISQGWCSECAGHVPLMIPEEAAVLAGISPQMIHKWIDAGRVHFAESPQESLLICLSSLLDESQIESTPPRA